MDLRAKLEVGFAKVAEKRANSMTYRDSNGKARTVSFPKPASTIDTSKLKAKNIVKPRVMDINANNNPLKRTNVAKYVTKDNTWDLAKFKRETYGDNFAKEVATADEYNKAKGIPYRMGAYLKNKPKAVSTASPAYNPRTGSVKIPLYKQQYDEFKEYLAREKPETGKNYMTDERLKRFGLRRGEVIGLKELLMHEGSHSATMGIGGEEDEYNNWAKGEVGKRYDTKPNWKTTTYLENSNAEWIPPATALQHHMYNTTGKRITDDAGYNSFVNKYKGLKGEDLDNKMDADKLPLELKRLLRYRDFIEGRDNAAPDAMDSMFKHILPGIVQNKAHNRNMVPG